eukprot:CCRYP_019275-RA/>CCRYP_019275-RA protein AED:0.44 eAED:0.33 QI:0/-1/0/1/-1/0/1/0/44
MEDTNLCAIHARRVTIMPKICNSPQFEGNMRGLSEQGWCESTLT